MGMSNSLSSEGVYDDRMERGKTRVNEVELGWLKALFFLSPCRRGGVACEFAGWRGHSPFFGQRFYLYPRMASDWLAGCHGMFQLVVNGFHHEGCLHGRL